jgi:hypothetical protein
VHAAFRFAKAVSIFAAHQQRRAFDARRFTRQRVGYFDFPTAPFAPTLIHAQQHICPIARLRSARARVDAQNAIALVMRAAKQRSQLKRIHLQIKSTQFAFDLLLEFKLRSFRLCLGQLDQRFDILQLLLGSDQGIDLLAQGGRFVD